MRLDDTSRRAVFLSAGLGHAFIALNDEAAVIYLCSTPYSPGREHGVHPLDPDIGIEWPTDTELVMSPKDGATPTLKQARRAGLLPVYADCETYLSSLRKAADRPSSLSGRCCGPLRGEEFREGAMQGRPPGTRQSRELRL